MKVVILAGGLGTRLSEYTKKIPKPMVKIKKVPIIVHIIKHYKKFGLKDFGVAPAGYNIPNTGHHHLIINADLPDLTLPIPANENYVHFGLGQTETTLTLEPGTYSLQLLMGNYLHIPHEKPLFSKAISITIE